MRVDMVRFSTFDRMQYCVMGLPSGNLL